MANREIVAVPLVKGVKQRDNGDRTAKKDHL